MEAAKEIPQILRARKLNFFKVEEKRAVTVICAGFQNEG
jgi:hypothetical protein